MKKELKDIVWILVGVTIFAGGVVWFAEPQGLITGGLAGLAIVIKELTSKFFGFGVPLSLTTIILNIPLFLISIRQRGFRFARKSLLAVTWLSIILWVFDIVPLKPEIGGDLFLAAIISGATAGVGIALVFRSLATTGGTDMLASIIKYRFPHFPIDKLMLFIDGAIILSGIPVFGIKNGLYAVVSVTIATKMINSVLGGIHFAKAAFILSPKNEEISQTVFEKLRRGNTGIRARGMYTKKDSEMLLVVMSPKEVVQLLEIVRGIDKRAFIMVTDVKQVLGEGFIEEYNPLTI
jgi:uncharacterized membrane-anchored protein YitT (DUF2179 family)